MVGHSTVTISLLPSCPVIGSEVEIGGWKIPPRSPKARDRGHPIVVGKVVETGATRHRIHFPESVIFWTGRALFCPTRKAIVRSDQDVYGGFNARSRNEPTSEF